MPTKPIARQVASTIAVVALVATGVFLAAPAHAAPPLPSHTAEQISWVTDADIGRVVNTTSYDRENGILGWTGSAFGDVGTLQLMVDGEDLVRFFDPDITIDEGADGVVYTGRQHYLETGIRVYDFSVALTLTITGNFATWEYTVDGPDASRVRARFLANVYAEDATQSTAVSDTIIVNGGPVYDSAIGGLRVTSNDPNLTDWEMESPYWLSAIADGANSSGALELTVNAFVIGYDPCSFDTAVDFATEIMSDVDSHLGQSFPEVSSCLELSPLALTAGQTVDTQVESTIDPLLDQSASEGAPTGYFAIPENVESAIDTLPTGLTGAIEIDENGISSFSITGTAPTAGTYSVPVMLYQTIDGYVNSVGAVSKGFPLTTTLTITVAAESVPDGELPSDSETHADDLPSGSEAPAGQLAVTGSDPSMLGLLGAIGALVAGAALTVLAQRRRA